MTNPPEHGDQPDQRPYDAPTGQPSPPVEHQEPTADTTADLTPATTDPATASAAEPEPAESPSPPASQPVQAPQQHPSWDETSSGPAYQPPGSTSAQSTYTQRYGLGTPPQSTQVGYDQQPHAWGSPHAPTPAWGQSPSGSNTYGQSPAQPTTGQQSWGQPQSQQNPGSQTSTYGTQLGNQQSYGQQPYGQQSGGQQSSDQPSFGQQSSGQQSFGQPSFGQQGLGQNYSSQQPSYQQPSYQQNSYQQPSYQQPYGAPASYPSSTGQPQTGAWQQNVVPPTKKRRTGLIVALSTLVVLFAAAAILLLVKPDLFTSQNILDEQQVALDVTTQYEEQFQTQLENFGCDKDELVVEKGESYQCSATTEAGDPVSITITITNDQGAYTWKDDAQ